MPLRVSVTNMGQKWPTARVLDAVSDSATSSTRNLRVFSRNFGVVASLALAVLCALRYLDVDATILLALIAVAPALLALTVAATAALTSWRALGIAVLVLTVLAGAWLPGPILPRTQCSLGGSGAERGVVVASHNIFVFNNDLNAVTAQVDEINPDVLLLQETTAEQLAVLSAELPALAHVESQGLQHILSRWPLGDVFASGTSTGGALVATVDSPLGELRVANVHPSAPLSGERRDNQRIEFEDLRQWRVSERVDVVMGDFNASAAQPLYRNVVSDGFVDAHRASGCGTGLTWSPRSGGGPAVLSLDHALVHERVGIESFVVFDYAGSDHRAIAVELDR